MLLAHRVQLIPRNRHKEAFHKACGVARYAWNWALAQWQSQYAAGSKPKVSVLKKQWNQVKPQWVYESPKDANQQPFTFLQRAFTSFFKGLSKYPQYKKKGVHDSFYLSNDRICVDGCYVTLPKIGRVKMTEEVRFLGKIMSATVSREADRWFISFQVDFDHQPQHGTEVLGVDLGVKDAVVLSDGTKHAGPKPLKTALRRLKKRQRQHSRKKRGSNNRKKSAMRLARLHRRVKNQRNDFLHKVTSHIVSKAKTVVLEDLNVRGMMKNRRLSRAISDIGFYEFRRQLEYKCAMNGVELIVADRFYPSTKLCWHCGRVNTVSLSQRIYVCGCGYTEDRDVNAAMNLRTLGLRETDACGHCVRPAGLGAVVAESGTQSLTTLRSCYI